MITRLAIWWLSRKGLYPTPVPLGVTLNGNCVAVGTPEDMQIYNPSRQITVLWGSVFIPKGVKDETRFIGSYTDINHPTGAGKPASY